MLAVLSKYWWVVALRGALAVLFGILAFVYPGLTLTTLVLFFGAWALVDGLSGVVGAFMGRGDRYDSWVFSLLGGLLGIGIGLVTFFMPGVTAIALVYYIAAWALLRGILDIAIAIKYHAVLKREWMLVVAGIVSILFSFLLFWNPAPGALALLWTIALYAIIFGIVMIFFGFRLYSVNKGLTPTV